MLLAQHLLEGLEVWPGSCQKAWKCCDFMAAAQARPLCLGGGGSRRDRPRLRGAQDSTSRSSAQHTQHPCERGVPHPGGDVRPQSSRCLVVWCDVRQARRAFFGQPIDAYCADRLRCRVTFRPVCSRTVLARAMVDERDRLERRSLERRGRCANAQLVPLRCG